MKQRLRFRYKEKMKMRSEGNRGIGILFGKFRHPFHLFALIESYSNFYLSSLQVQGGI